MAHFAKLGVGNKVLEIVTVSNDVAKTEEDGANFLNNLFKTNDIWKQTSYNTRGGVHRLGGTPYRKNYAMVGGRYDMYADAFVDPKPWGSWILNETTYLWEAPIDKPDDDRSYRWNEDTKQWDLDE